MSSASGQPSPRVPNLRCTAPSLHHPLPSSRPADRTASRLTASQTLPEPVTFRSRPCPPPHVEITRPVPLRTRPPPSVTLPGSLCSYSILSSGHSHERAARSWSTGEIRPSAFSLASSHHSPLSCVPTMTTMHHNLHSHHNYHHHHHHHLTPHRVVSFGSAVTSQSTGSTSTEGEEARRSGELLVDDDVLRRRRIATFVTSRSNSSASSVDWGPTSATIIGRRDRTSASPGLTRPRYPTTTSATAPRSHCAFVKDSALHPAQRSDVLRSWQFPEDSPSACLSRQWDAPAEKVTSSFLGMRRNRARRLGSFADTFSSRQLRRPHSCHQDREETLLLGEGAGSRAKKKLRMLRRKLSASVFRRGSYES